MVAFFAPAIEGPVMKRVVYYHAGLVADFGVPDELYVAFAERAASIPGDPDAELEKARKVLSRFMAAAADGDERVMGDNEAVAACYIWHHLNHVISDDGRIDGDVLIADEEGEGDNITYMPLADVELVEDDG
jgi:hypothetical protein